jgi:hypothetical protein
VLPAAAVDRRRPVECRAFVDSSNPSPNPSLTRRRSASPGRVPRFR